MVCKIQTIIFIEKKKKSSKKYIERGPKKQSKQDIEEGRDSYRHEGGRGGERDEGNEGEMEGR